MERKNKKIVVMGGSFNPPTIAHYILMKETVKALEADKGLFVPVSDAYLRRKMRQSHPPVVLSPEMRINMLRTMCTDNRLSVCEKDMGTLEPRTIPTLMALQEENPGAELYFLLGADKLKLLTDLAVKRKFLDYFRVVLYARGDKEFVKILKENEAFSNYLPRITILPQPSGIDGISSSKIRERMLSGESCQEMLYPGVWNLFKTFSSADFPDVIERFRGEYEFLSNRFACQFVWQGLKYANAEAAFQSSKCVDKKGRKVFCTCSADKAAMIGRGLVPPPEWNESRLSIMESILSAKFEQNPCLMSMLLKTGNAILVYGNNRRDTFWGVDLYSWQGENHLGKLLTTIKNKEKTI